MREDFDKCLAFVFMNEGGDSNHKFDRGGRTRYGITEGTLNRAYRQKIVKHCDVGKLSRAEAADIYKAFYWIPSCCDYLPYPFCCIHFDAAVNSGVGGAAKLLQRTLNRFCKAGLKVDGAVGPMTRAAMKAVFNASDYPQVSAEVCGIYCDARGELYEKIIKRNPSQEVFRRGWFARLDRCRRLCA